MFLRAIATGATILFLNGSAAAAQLPVHSVNPQAIEFEPPSANPADLIEYQVDFFLAGSDTWQDSPVKSIQLAPRVLRENGTVRVDVLPALTGVPDGQYIAIISVLGENGTVARSAPSEMFVLSRGVAAPAVQDQSDFARRERFWTRVGFAIIGGFLLVPFLVR